MTRATTIMAMVFVLWLALADAFAAPTAADTGSVSGKVVDADGKPLAGAEVSVLVVVDRAPKTLAKAKSDKDGAFKLESVPPGQGVRVWVSFQIPSGPMLSAEVRDLKVEAGKNTDAGTLTLAPARM